MHHRVIGVGGERRCSDMLELFHKEKFLRNILNGTRSIHHQRFQVSSLKASSPSDTTATRRLHNWWYFLLIFFFNFKEKSSLNVIALYDWLASRTDIIKQITIPSLNWCSPSSPRNPFFVLFIALRNSTLSLVRTQDERTKHDQRKNSSLSTTVENDGSQLHFFHAFPT